MLKYALGTAQFGLNYGINNSRGQIPESEVGEILHLASESGIALLDTAGDYGNSEELIGRFNESSKNCFKIITKIAGGNAQQSLSQSLERLKVETVYGVLMHHFHDFKNNPSVWDDVECLKKAGKAQKIGFSLYYPQELEHLLHAGVRFDMVQVPYNVFDRRFEQYLKELKRQGVEIHTRSVFLQGLMFKNPQELKGHLSGITPKINALQAMAQEHRIPLAALAVNFCALNPMVDKVVLGIDSKDHLKTLLESDAYRAQTQGILNQLQQCQEDKEALILPVNWR